MSAGTAAALSLATFFVLAGAAVLAIFAGGRETAVREDDDDLAVARAVGVVPGGDGWDPDVTDDERAAEAAWLAELFAASPDAPATGINP